MDTLGRLVEWVPVCPEVEVGMGTPRPAMRLERHADSIRLITPATGQDHTDAMNAYAERRVRELENLDGYVLKKDSPSCGIDRITVYDADGASHRSGRGLFAEALIARYPQLPVEEEGQLADERRREDFLARVFAYAQAKGH